MAVKIAIRTFTFAKRPVNIERDKTHALKKIMVTPTGIEPVFPP